LAKRNRREQGVEGASVPSDAQRLCDGGGIQISPLLYGGLAIELLTIYRVYDKIMETGEQLKSYKDREPSHVFMLKYENF